MKLIVYATILIAFSVSGCATNDRVSLIADQDQQALTRDGVQTLASKKKHLVMLKPGSRLVRSGARPAFVVAIRNLGKSPLEFRTADLRAELVTQKSKKVALRIYSYDELVGEAEDQRNTQLVLAALAGVANSYSAANAGYVNTTGSYNAYGPYGGTTYGTYQATTYDPYRAQLAQRAAADETSSNIAAIQEDGERSLEALSNTIIKDHTLLPGEWYGGSVVLASPPRSDDGATEYLINVQVAGEVHTFKVAQMKFEG